MPALQVGRMVEMVVRLCMLLAVLQMMLAVVGPGETEMLGWTGAWVGLGLVQAVLGVTVVGLVGELALVVADACVAMAAASA
mmetsp:Transcript_73363/g.137101  ORF Transcript_73363/g.137101 Transcript_73363/m.137101 type:complete len:82 (-) Transcript_73363:493-738(-)